MKKGFTLIEVMVSASIIALLAAIVFANINQGRVKAEEVKALQETKQTQTALELYHSTYSNYPNGSRGISTSGLQNTLVPSFISSLPEKAPIGNICFNRPSTDYQDEIQYYSNNGVATYSIYNFRCGPTGGADDYIIFYPTREKVAQENAVYMYYKPYPSIGWGVLGFQDEGGSSNGNCHWMSYSENNVSYELAAAQFTASVNYQYKCVPALK